MSDLQGALISIYEEVYCKMLHNNFSAENDDLKCCG